MQKKILFSCLIFAVTFFPSNNPARAEEIMFSREAVKGTVQFVSSDNAFIFTNLGNGQIEEGDIVEIKKEQKPIATCRVNRVLSDMSEAKVLKKENYFSINIGDDVVATGSDKGSYEIEVKEKKPLLLPEEKANIPLEAEPFSATPEGPEHKADEAINISQKIDSLEKEYSALSEGLQNLTQLSLIHI